MTSFPNVACVGMHFRGQTAKDIVELLEIGSAVALEREPENPYDTYAIKVLHGVVHIGYIERGQAAWISPLLDEGRSATAAVTSMEMRGKNLHPILLIEVA